VGALRTGWCTGGDRDGGMLIVRLCARDGYT